METEYQHWHDFFTADKWAEILELHAERVARQYGEYSFHHDLRMAAQCIRDLAEERDTLRAAGGDLVRQVMAARESLSKLP
jgi:hypothetical protein